MLIDQALVLGVAKDRLQCAYAAARYAGAIATLLIGQGLIAFVRSPLLRVGIALLFAIPAGIAGFQAAHALGSLATDNSMLLAILGSIAAMATSLSAWRSVTMSERDTCVTSQFAGPVGGQASSREPRLIRKEEAA